MAEGPSVSTWFFRLLRLAVAGVFVYAGATKAIDPAGFRLDIARYQLAPEWLAFAAAAYLPWLEIVAGIGLWLPRFRRGAEAIMLALMIVFVAALLSAWARGLDVACGCFGHEAEARANYPWVLARDAVLIAAIAALAWRSRGRSASV